MPHSNMNKSLQIQFFFLFVLALVYLINPASSSACNGSIAECNEGNEELMGSEISQRLLAQQKVISYGALNKNQPVCNGGGRGEAYSKNGGCLPPPSNPQTRGCSKYYRCRSGSWSFYDAGVRGFILTNAHTSPAFDLNFKEVMQHNDPSFNFIWYLITFYLSFCNMYFYPNYCSTLKT